MRPADPVRPDHYATLDYMATLQFRRVKDLFDRYPEIGGVYFRPRRDGVVVVNLHPDSPKPRGGVGDEYVICRGMTVDDILPTMTAHLAQLRRARTQQEKPSREFQFEASLIRSAQANGLRLPGFPPSVCFINSQWRIDGPGGGKPKFVDLIALDLRSRAFVLVELKGTPDPSALQQVEPYLAYFKEYAAVLAPFFAQAARVMGTLYNRLELAGLDTKTVGGFECALAAWPDAQGQTVLSGADPLLSLPQR